MAKASKLPMLPQMAADMAIGADPKRTGLAPEEALYVPREQFLALIDAAKAIPSPSAALTQALADVEDVELSASVVAVPSGAQLAIATAVSQANPLPTASPV